MKIWKLSVFNEVSFDWRASTYKGETIIRAESEHNARRLATLSFFIAKPRASDGTIAANPWTQKNLVSCESIEDERYNSTGEEEVLFPK